LSLGHNELLAVSEHRKIQQLSIEGAEIPVLHDFKQAIESQIEIVFLCNPTSMHADYLARALNAGKHVFLEKPAATTATELTTVMKMQRSNSPTIAVGHQFRFNPHLLELKENVEQGSVGRILQVEAVQGEHIADYHPKEDYRQGYAARADLGGGVLLTQIHQIDYLNWLFGPFESVTATGGQTGMLEIDVEDNVSYILQNRDAIGVYGHVNFLRRPKQVRMTVSGTEGTFNWDYYAGLLSWTPSRANASTRTVSSTAPRNQMFRDLVVDFLDAIAGQYSPRSTLEDGLTSLKIVDAIKQSLQSRRSSLIN
jgi:predicted dehydrogenase